MIFAFLLAFAIKPIWWASGGDSRVYLSVAQSLWEHFTLESLGEPEIFNQIGVAIFFAPAYAFGDRPFLVLSIFQWLAAVGTMLGCYQWFQRYINRDDSILLTGLVMFNVCYWICYLRFLSEIWCCFLLVCMALVLRHIIDVLKDQRFGLAWAWQAASIPLSIWMVLTRNVTSMIAPGFAIAVLLLAWQSKRRKMWVHALLLIVLTNAVAGSTAVGWQWYQGATVVEDKTVHGSYMEFLANDMGKQGDNLLSIAADNTHRRMTNIGRAMVPGMFRTYPEIGQWLHPLSVLNAALSVILLIGFFKLARGKLDAYTWMPLFFMVLMWAIPYEGGTRFVLPILPVMWLCLHRVLEGRSWRKTVFLVLLVMHVIVTVGRVATVYPLELARDQDWALMERIAQRTREIDVENHWYTVGVDSDWVNMISLASNRPIWEWHDRGDRLPEHIIVFDGAEPPEGYSLIQTIDKYHLMEKR